MQNKNWRPSSNLNSERVVRYVLFPEIWPRIQELGRSFRHFAFIIALLFGRAGIFRANHSFLNPNNIGKFSLGDVLGTAAANIRFNRQHLPQAAIFLSVIGMTAIITLQLILTLVISFTGEAQAAALLPANAFTAPNPDEDLALNFLSHMLGVYDFMGVPTGVGTGPLTREVGLIHTGLHEMLAFYNVMMMLVGAFIMGYYAVASFLETAMTGVPFGRRFSGWATPLRGVIAFAILMPLPMPPNGVGVTVSGFNAAQYMVLFAARTGSGFASNLFNIYIASITDPDHAQDYVATPQLPEVAKFVEGMFNMLLCIHANDRAVDGQREWLDRTPPQMAEFWRKSDAGTDGWVVAPINTPGALLNAYRADLAANPGGIGDLAISAGPRDDKDLCGVISMPGNQIADDAASTEDAWRIREAYIAAMDWFVFTSGAYGLAHDIVEMTMSADNTEANFGDTLNLPAADKMRKDEWMTHIRNNILNPVFQASGAAGGAPSQWRQRLEANIGARMVYDRGWAGAALFYNDITEANLVLQHAAKSIPRMTDRPGPLENYEATKKSVLDGMKEGAMTAIKDEMPKVAEEGVSFGSLLRIGWGGLKGLAKQTWAKVKTHTMNTFSDSAKFEAELGESVGAGADWFLALPTAETNYREPESIWGEIGELALRTIGLGALADLQGDDPRETNPLVTMQQLGSTLQKSSAIVGIIGLVLGGINRFGSAAAGNFFFAISAFFWTLGTFLANILPIIPFVFFFFGVVQWGFSVFEAIVAAPMLALTHLRFTSGDDRLIPQNAVQGYLMILEIGLRPLMLIFGLIASIVCFSAAASLLHQTFFNAANAALGPDSSGPIDSLVMIAVYIFQIYMLAMATFKLITIIPMGIMRWFGLGAAQSLDDVVREQEAEQDNLIMKLAATKVFADKMYRDMPTEGPTHVKTADGEMLKLTVRPDGQMFAKMRDGTTARVKEVGKQGLFLVDPNAAYRIRPVSLVNTGASYGGWNSDAQLAAQRREGVKAFGRGVGND